MGNITHRDTHTLEGTKKQEDTLVFFFPSHFFCIMIPKPLILGEYK